MRFTVILNESEGKALQHVSLVEDRHPRDQARRILRDGLIRAGVLTDDTRQTPAPAGPGEAA